ncbi:MAG: alpha/beta hydrolase [Eudoraea sp.]|nr:alpha/beta hydrolase [Eudoraea sp.]
MTKYFQRILPKIYGSYFNALALISKEKVAEKAYLLFCTPRKGRILPIQSQFLENSKNEVITVGDMKVQTYSWDGDRETVLLLHGWESNSFRWRNLIGFLKREGYGVLAFDAPAHGHSSGSLFNVLRYTDCTQTIVSRYNPDYIIGHSVGGMTALYHQYLFPENSLKKVVSIGAPAEFSDVTKRYQELLGFNNRVLKALDAYYKKHFGFGIDDFSTAEYAKNITIPGLLIHDELDLVAPFWASEKVHANWNNSQLIKTQGLGHSMHQEHVNEQIIDYLKS